MSRCFPYPPPGFNVNRASNDALIESIKLQKEREKAKAGRKKEKKEKREKRREKKERKRDNKEYKGKAKPTSTGIGHDHAHKGEKGWTDLERGYNKKRKVEDTEQLEKSGLTEEHGQPLNLQNPSYLSDSTQNSNKRRRQNSPISSNNGHGKILRIRLPLQKHKQPDVSAIKKPDVSANKEPVVSAYREQVCSTSGRTDLHGHHRRDDCSRVYEENICSASLGTNNGAQCLPFCPDKEMRSTSGRVGILTQDDKRVGPRSIPVESEMQTICSLYNSLIQNLAPWRPHEISDIDDEEWLFSSKRSTDRVAEEQSKVNSNVSCCSDSVLFSHAEYMPEAGIYALPYTVPF